MKFTTIALAIMIASQNEESNVEAVQLNNMKDPSVVEAMKTDPAADESKKADASKKEGCFKNSSLSQQKTHFSFHKNE